MPDRATFSPSEGGDARWFLGTLATIRLAAEASEGRFALLEIVLPRGASPPLHTHPQDESYVVLEGSLTVVAGDDRSTLGPGGAVAVPGGVPHTFRAESDEVRALLVSTPAGIERMILDASVPAAAPTLPPSDAPRPSRDELAEIFERHEMALLGPSLGPDD